MPNEAFIGKATKNNKEKGEEEEKIKGDNDDGSNIICGGTKRGEKMRGGIHR